MKHRINLMFVGLTLVGLMAIATATAAPPKKPSKSTTAKPAPRKGDNIKAQIAIKAQIMQGHSLFVTNCAVCHGASGGGDDGPSLRQKHMEDSFVTIAIQMGFKDEMPPFGSKLKEKEQKAIVAYVHSLQ